MNRKTQFYIKRRLARAIHNARKGYRYNTLEYIQNVRHVLVYLLLVGDITEETYDKIYNLTTLIQKKYDIY